MKAIACADLGTSGTKVIGAFQEAAYPCKEVERYWLIEPSVQRLTQATYDSRLEEIEDFGNHSVQSSVISFCNPECSEERLLYEVGVGASKPGRLITNRRKFQDSLVKVLALIGYMAIAGFGTEDATELHIGVLLPFNEISDRKQLAKWLKTAIPSLVYDGIAVENIKVASIRVMPEGFGIYKTYRADRVLIAGHRDTTLLAFEGGKLLGKETVTFPESGFHDFIQRIRFPFHYELQASDLIFRAGPSMKQSILRHLTQTKGEAELNQLIQAIADAREQYWLARKAQIESISYEGVQAIAISGGAAHYFNKEITALFRGLKIRSHWCKPLMLEFFERFELEKKSALLHRFADCYGFYQTLPGVPEFSVVKGEVA